jgi:hypothetical protein
LVIEIPSWMEKSAPGAAAAARSIGDGPLSDSQRQRLERLTSETTRRAWLEPLRQRNKSKKTLSEPELWAAHHELMLEAYRAADFQPIGQSEIEQSTATLLEIGTAVKSLAHEIGEAGSDGQLVGMWLTYRNGRRDDALLERLPSHLPLVATALERLADFFQQASKYYKPQGPVPPVGQPGDRDALKTTVIRQIAQTCRIHFDAVLHSTVATLANASLNRTDIDRYSVAGSLRNSR